jgi:branched-chain amino acid transport system substrate-binding protein
MRQYLLICAALLCTVTLTSANANQKESNEIVFGMSGGFTGPTKNIGIDMERGITAAISEVNEYGGIQNKYIKLITLDDGYEPDRAAVNVTKLINDYNVVCIIGNVGTPTALVALPIVDKYKVPFYGAFTGAGLLRKNPPDRYVINYRTSYAQEAAEIAEQLITKSSIKPEEIAFLTQRDTYGNDGYQGAIKQLKKYDREIESKIAHGYYNRNTTGIEKALAKIILHKPTPKAVIMIATYTPAAEFIRVARSNGFNPLFLNVSGANPLAKTLGEYGDGVIVTQIVPHYDQTELKIVEQYRNAMLKANQEFSSISLEGYIAAKILFKALERIEGNIDRKSIIESLENLGDFDIGLGQKLSLNRNNHQACNTVWAGIIFNQTLEPFDWNDLKNF